LYEKNSSDDVSSQISTLIGGYFKFNSRPEIAPNAGANAPKFPVCVDDQILKISRQIGN